jgi:hypothetical protein
MIETTTSVIEEHQIIKDARCRGGRASNTRLFIASFIYVIGFAERLEIRSITIKIEANVCDVFFEEWHHRIWVSNVSRNTKRMFVAIR